MQPYEKEDAYEAHGELCRFAAKLLRRFGTEQTIALLNSVAALIRAVEDDRIKDERSQRRRPPALFPHAERVKLLIKDDE